MIYFVTEEYIKTKTPITANVDAKSIVPWIEVAADSRLRPLIGTSFYKYLLTKYNAGTLNTAETELIAYVKKYVAWRAAALAVWGVSRPIKNIGVQQVSSQNSQPEDLVGITGAQDNLDRIVVNYERELKAFLKDNGSNYPDFVDKSNKDSEIKRTCDRLDSDDQCTIALF